MGIDDISTQTDFEVLEFVDDKNPYPALLRIDWATKMKGILNLKICKMKFEQKSLQVVVLLDPAKGERYTKLVHNKESGDELDCIYQIIMQEPDQMQSIDNRRTSWECESIYTMDSEEEAERWQNQLHAITTLDCNMVTQSVRCVTTEERPRSEENGVIVEAQLTPQGTLCIIQEQPSVPKDRLHAHGGEPQKLGCRW